MERSDANRRKATAWALCASLPLSVCAHTFTAVLTDAEWHALVEYRKTL
ncbi:hypothetical protein AAG565_12415 [Fontimonas sp. SYSU GA230001]